MAGTSGTIKADIILPQTSGKGLGIKGVTDGSAATAGDIGEVISSTASAVNSPGSNQYFTVTSIVLTAGVWAVSALVSLARNGATYAGGSLVEIEGGIGTVDGNSPTGLTIGDTDAYSAVPGTALETFSFLVVSVPSKVFTLTATTTYYLKAYSRAFSAGTPQASGRITAIRIR